METINIHQAKTHLSRLVDRAVKGKSFIIVKAGKPMVKVTALDAPTGKQICRLGFLEGQMSIPDNFDTMGSREIRKLLGTIRWG
jgi:prevent-host-death family protein